jgi:hypothetical protein
MKVRAYIAAAGAAALVGTGAFLLPAVASPHVTTHTLKFISVQKNSTSFSSTTFAGQDTDVNKAHKTIGFDEVYFKAVSASAARGNVTADLKGGMLYGTFRLSFKTGAITKGKVTGGTGAFKGATGTIKVTAVNKAGTRHAVTITYHT